MSAVIKPFISYSSKDKDKAIELERIFESNNIKALIDEKDVFSGDVISDRVMGLIKKCSHLVVLISENSVNSPWVNFEIGMAKMDGKGIIPYIIDKTIEVQAFLAGIKKEYNSESLVANLANLSRIKFDKSNRADKDLVLVVGSANIEYLYLLKNELKIGRKQPAEVSESVGGGGLNVSLRLLKMGVNVLPVLHYGNDDAGLRVKRILSKSADIGLIDKRVSAYIKKNDSRRNGFVTMRAAILTEGARNAKSHGGDRSVIFHEIEQPQSFYDYVMDYVSEIENELLGRIGTIVISHISEEKDINCKLTKWLIDKFSAEGCLIYTCFGKSQYTFGIEFWRDYLPKIDIFQLNLEEYRTFFGVSNIVLPEMVKDLSERETTFVVTLDELGAVCTTPNESVILAVPPYSQKNAVDTTGAGDAFAAGIVYKTLRQEQLNQIILQDALDDARIWAANACMAQGGASTTPTKNELEVFKKLYAELHEKRTIVEDLDKNELYDMLNLLDIAYSFKFRTN